MDSTRVRARRHTRIYTHTHWRTQSHTHTHTNTFPHTHTHLWRACVWVWVCAGVCVRHINTNICLAIHRYTYGHIIINRTNNRTCAASRAALEQIEWANGKASKTKAGICQARRYHAIALDEFRDEPTIGVYDDMFIALAEARLENIGLRAQASQRGARERSIILHQHANIITHERHNKCRMKKCEDTLSTCISGCICLPKSKRLMGNVATKLVLGEQYYCHHRSKGYHLAIPCLRMAPKLRPNQIYALFLILKCLSESNLSKRSKKH